MKHLFTLLILLSCALLTAQNFRVNFNAGISGSYFDDPGYALGFDAEYAFPLNKKTNLILGTGYQRLKYIETPVENAPWFCLGNCVFNFTETETYTLRSGNVSLNLGFERRLGKWSVRLIASPTYRADAKISARFITIPNDSTRPNTERTINLKPGENILRQDTGAETIDYTKDFYLRLGLEAGYELSSSLTLSLAYRQMVTKYEVIYFNGGCGIVECFTSERTRFDARTGALLVTMRYAF